MSVEAGSERGAADPQGPGRPASEVEGDIAEYALAVWARKWTVTGVGALCAAIVLGIGLLTPPAYEAAVRLVVMPPKTGAAGEVSPVVNVATFRALAENQSIVATVVSEFKLNAGPFNLSVARFIRDALSVDMMRDTNVIAIKVQLRDAQTAAKVANRIADLAVELSQRLSRDETVRARDYIQTQVDYSRQRLDEAQARLEEFKKRAQIELLRKDVEATLGQRGGLLQLLVEIQVETARLARAEEQLAKRPKIDTVTRTIDQDPALMEAARETGGSQRSVLGLQMKNESLSKVYEALEEVIAVSRTRLSGLEKQKAELIDTRKLDASQLGQLSRLYEAETELARRTLDFDLARDVYKNAATRLEEARLQVVGRSAQLQVMDTALAPDRPVAPRIVRNTVLAFAVGLALAALAVLFYGVERVESARRSA